MLSLASTGAFCTLAVIVRSLNRTSTAGMRMPTLQMPMGLQAGHL